MAFYSYCRIHMVLIAMSCVRVDNFNTDGKSLCAKRKCPYLHDEHYDTVLAAKRRMKLDDLADELGEISRADIDKLQLPHFAHAFGKNVGLYEYSQLGTFDKCQSSHLAEYNDGNGGLGSSRNVRYNIYHDVCTSSNPQELRNITTSHEQANSNNPHNYINPNQTQNISQTESRSYTNPDHCTLNSFGTVTAQLGLNNRKFSRVTIQIAYLLMNSSWHDVPIDQLDFLNSFETVEDKFNELLKGYKLLWQRTNQYCSATKFNFGIINSDLKMYEIVQKRNPVENLDKRYTKNDSQSVVSVPDFETYYKRCKSNLICKINKYIIFSQEWSNFRETEEYMLLYTDLAIALARLSNKKFSTNNISTEIRKVCDLYFIDYAYVFKEFDNDNTRYDPANYASHTDNDSKITNLYVPIDVSKYTLVNAKDYEEKFAIFKQFIFDIFFGKHPSRDFYTIKEELWRLQMYMPEIYLYLTWRLTITNNISVGFGDEEYGLKEEIEILADLVDSYILHSRNEVIIKTDTDAMMIIVNKCRSNILAMLKYHYGTNAIYQFYRLAHKSSYRNSSKNHLLRNKDILSILAFAPKSESCESLSQSIINFGNNESLTNKNNAAPKQNEKYQQNARNDMTAKETSKKSNTKKDQKKLVDVIEKHMTLSEFTTIT